MAVRVSKGNRGVSGHKTILGSIIVALGIVAGAVLVANHRKPEIKQEVYAPVVAEFDAAKFPVPVEPVPAGTKVRDIKFTMASFPRHQVPQSALESLEGVIDGVTVAPLPANLPIYAANFSKIGGGRNPVLEKIPPGMRAMTIKVDATTAVEGWAGSGSIVDVLLIEKEKTTVIAEKVQILSAERSVSPVEGASAPSVPSTVTLLVTQEQCLAINTGIPLGRIAFALRSNRDDESWRDVVYTTDRLKAGPAISEEKVNITGYVSVKDEGEDRSFALSNGKWIRTEVVPEGFFGGK